MCRATNEYYWATISRGGNKVSALVPSGVLDSFEALNDLVVDIVESP